MLGTAAVSLAVRVAVAICAVLASARFGVGLFAWRAAERLEKPQYDMLRRLSAGVELRRYAPYVIAETLVAGDARMQSKEGFRKVAGYIFGKNGAGQKMAMTAPVRMEPDGKARMKVSFVMESAYSTRTAPRPSDRGVVVKNVPGHVLAARTFSGPPPGEARVAEERLQVVEALEAVGLRPASEETLVYGYHDPFITPNRLRRNEVCVRVRDSALCEAEAPAT